MVSETVFLAVVRIIELYSETALLTWQQLYIYDSITAFFADFGLYSLVWISVPLALCQCVTNVYGINRSPRREGASFVL
jgi:hypothetical protein